MSKSDFWGGQGKKIFMSNVIKTKMLEIAWFGEKIDRKCFLKFLTIFISFLTSMGGWPQRTAGKPARPVHRGARSTPRGYAPLE